MGLLDKLIRGVNKAAEPMQDLDVRVMTALSPSERRTRRLTDRGITAEGTVVGIERTLNDGRTEIRLAVVTGSGRHGVHLSGKHLGRIRLGLPVVVRTDDKHVILDWTAMTSAWGLDDDWFAQASCKPPDGGITEKALDMRVSRRLKNWTPTRATIESFEQRRVLGMAAENWNIQARLADGSTAVTPGDEVPFYCRWHLAPGADVPVVRDPKDQGKVQIDWVALAMERLDTVGFDDDPQPGSIAALTEASTPEATSMMSAGTAPPAASVPAAEPALNVPSGVSSMMIGQLLKQRRKGRMTAELLASTLDEYVAQGICTADQAAEARRSDEKP